MEKEPLQNMQTAEVQGPVVQSVISLTELVKGHFVNCFSEFNTQYSDLFC